MLSVKHHPNIVRCLNCFLEENQICIEQEYCDRGDLNQLMGMQQGMPFREVKVKKFVIEILLALDCIHDLNIVHRDLKPSNIFVKGRNLEVKIGDFGVSCHFLTLTDREDDEWAEHQQLQYRDALLLLA